MCIRDSYHAAVFAADETVLRVDDSGRFAVLEAENLSCASCGNSTDEMTFAFLGNSDFAAEPDVAVFLAPLCTPVSYTHLVPLWMP